MSKPELTEEERLNLIEWALVGIQNYGRGPYLGLCVNAGLDDYDHPHWDEEHVKLARASHDHDG